MVSLCYEKFQNTNADTREVKMDQCIQKWRKVFAYVDSQELMDSYTNFYKKTKK